MSLHPKAIPPVPEETSRVAYAAFPKGNIYLQIRDTLGSIYVDEDFADLFPLKGQPAQSPWRLALICVMQYMENLSDRQALESFHISDVGESKILGRCGQRKNRLEIRAFFAFRGFWI